MSDNITPLCYPTTNEYKVDAEGATRKPVGYRLSLETIGDIKNLGKRLNKTDTEIVTDSVALMKDHREAYKLDALDDPIMQHYTALQWCYGVFEGMGRMDLVDRLGSFFETGSKE